MMHVPKIWFRLAVVNLFLVSALGLLMRYKIGYSLPVFEQKFIQHAHSHFAFAGWVSHVLFALMLSALSTREHIKAPGLLLMTVNINLVLAYGMLASFLVGGYNTASIVLSSLSVLNTWVFSWQFLRNTPIGSDRGDISLKWFRAGLVFNALSAVGTAVLAQMMASGHYDQHIYLGSVYYYLHFQYNGFFFFVCMGIFLRWLSGITGVNPDDRRLFQFFFWSCVPAFLLSVLWLDLHPALLAVVVIAGLAQVAGLVLFVKLVYGHRRAILVECGRTIYIMFLISAGAFSIKVALQMVSTVPALSELAFGFRPIVIAYLHLVLLVMISLFLISYVMKFIYGINSVITIRALVWFAAGVLLNELILALQGALALVYEPLPLANELLLTAAAVIFIALAVLLISSGRSASGIIARRRLQAASTTSQIINTN